MSARLRSQLGLPLLAALGLGAAAWAQGYSASDLGGRAPASAFGINPAGRIVGSITPADQSRATLWPRAGESPVQLELLAGTNWSRAFGINARGQIVGQAQDKTVLPVQVFAMFWRIADAVPVALAGGTIAVAINNAGQIAGNMRTDLGEIHAALWADSTSDPVDLGTLGGTSSSAAGLNDAGQVVGLSRDAAGVLRAAFWPSAEAPPIDLGAPVGALRAGASGINERGEIVGDFFFTATARRALFWPVPGAVPMELQGLGGDESQAVAINERGLIVGWAEDAEGERHACLWTSAALPPIDLGTLGSATSFARAINPAGQIVGDDGPAAASRPVVWRRSR